VIIIIIIIMFIIILAKLFICSIKKCKVMVVSLCAMGGQK